MMNTMFIKNTIDVQPGGFQISMVFSFTKVSVYSLGSPNSLICQSSR